jgi:flagellin-like protein
VRKIKSRKAVSPVIATVILVAVAITVAVAVSYWMSGISSQYTKFEKVEIQSGVCTWNDTTSLWDIEMKLKNTGTATSTLIGCFINEVEVTDYNGTGTDGAIETDMTDSCTITSGQSKTIMIYVSNTWKTVSAGTTVNVKIHSAGGMDYIKLIELV